MPDLLAHQHGANRIADNLDRDGIQAAAIHGNKSQGACQRALEDLRTGHARASLWPPTSPLADWTSTSWRDYNYDMPADAENYVHRVGRTGRAGGRHRRAACSDGTERSSLKAIERLTRQAITVEPLPEGMPAPAAVPAAAVATAARAIAAATTIGGLPPPERPSRKAPPPAP